jgi:hypothetical protein
VHDDIVDEVSQVVIYITGSGPLRFETVSWGYGVAMMPGSGGNGYGIGYNQAAMIGAQNGVYSR